MAGTERWKRIGKTEEAAAFLRMEERRCVNACSRFLNLDRSHDKLWAWYDTEKKIRALILFSRRSLFLISKGEAVPEPRFMAKFIRKNYIHAVQGGREDAEQLEMMLANNGRVAMENINYDLMELDGNAPVIKKSPSPGLILRKPRRGDEDDIFILQAGYEQEEVLPRASVFNPASCRVSMERILKKEQILVAEMDSKIVGKINTSAASFSRYQIGGVYVHPAYRGRGIAGQMCSAFIRELLPSGRGLTLFVKKNNSAARSVYLRSGFETSGNYRISYY